MIKKHIAEKNTAANIDNDVFEMALSDTHRLYLNSCLHVLSLFCVNNAEILYQQHLTKNEFSIFNALIVAYPHYLSYGSLLSVLTSVSSLEWEKRLNEVRKLGPQELKRELKPVHRALSGVRTKLHSLSSYFKISLIRDTGYTLVIIDQQTCSHR